MARITRLNTPVCPVPEVLGGLSFINVVYAISVLPKIYERVSISILLAIVGILNSEALQNLLFQRLHCRCFPISLVIVP